MLIQHFPVVLVVSIAAGFIAGGVVIFIRRFIHLNVLTRHHEVAFPIFLQIGVIFAVLVAFIFSLSWGIFYGAAEGTENEAVNYLVLFELSPGFPEPEKTKIQTKLTQYLQLMIHQEWPKLSLDQEDPATAQAFESLKKIYLNYTPKTEKEIIIYKLSLDNLMQASKSREKRIFIITGTHMGKLIFYLVCYSLTVIGISYFFGMPNIWVQAILTGALAATIFSIVIMISFFVHPYSGYNFSIHTHALDKVSLKIQQISKSQSGK